MANINRLIGSVLFFLILFTPTTYQAAKGSLLLLTLAGVFIGSLLANGDLKISPQVVLLGFFFSCLGGVSALYSYARGNPGALHVVTVYVFWPLVFSVLSAAVSDLKSLKILHSLLVWTTLMISMYAIMYVSKEMGFIPDWMYFTIDQGQEFSRGDGSVEYNLYSLATLLYSIPLCIALWLLSPSGFIRTKKSAGLLIVIIVSVIASLLSGRRALWVVIGLAPFITAVFSLMFPTVERRFVLKRLMKSFLFCMLLSVPILLVIQRFGNLNLSSISSSLIAGFTFTGDNLSVAERDRHDQYFALIESWSDSPVLGSGLGGVASIIRSDEHPWSYELTYVALLFQVGFLGLAAYGLGIFWMLTHCWRIVAKGGPYARFICAHFVGLCSFLIANASNPYLAKFDYMWVIFLPIAMINANLISHVTPIEGYESAQES
jgi:hypothetical protein